MRLLELRLTAFGPFTDQTLDLSAPGLHVVYGPNEAGKSTALRAIFGLLYGIPTRTPDAHIHPYGKLRIGARIEHDGEVIDVVRAKGNKNTLRDRNDRPIDEARLRRALGGVTQALFESMFGLDHQSLRAGARALLRGEGDLGESLFDAGGARGVGAVVDGLRAEAEAIHKPRGRKQELNQALSRLQEAREAIKRRTVEPSAVTEQRRGLREAESERQAREEERAELEAERQRLTRLSRAIPNLAKRRELLSQRRALGAIPSLPADAAGLRREAERKLDQCERDEARLGAEIAEVEQQLADCRVDERARSIDTGQLHRIGEGLGRHRSALADRPKRVGELRARQKAVAEQLRELGRPEDADVDALVVDKQWQRRIAALARSQEALAAKLEAAEKAVRERRREREALPEPPEPVDPEPLEAAVRRARRLGDVDERIDALDRRIAGDTEEVDRLAGALGLSAEEATARTVPARQDVEAVIETQREQASTVRQLGDRRRALSEERQRAEAGLAELEAAGDVPTEETLVAARKKRDEALAALGDPPDGHAQLRERIAECDALADRRFREVERVTRHARLRAELDRAAKLDAQLEAEEAALEAAMQRTEAELEASWGGRAPPPSKMLGWLDTHDRLRAAIEGCAERRREREHVAEERDEARAALAAELTSGPEGDRLAPWIDAAEVVLERRRETARRAREIGEEQRRLEAAIAAAEEDRATHHEAMAQWTRAWSEAMSALGLAAETEVEEALGAVEGLRELEQRARAAAEIRRRIEGIDRDAEAFEALVRPLADEVVDGVEAMSTEAAARALIDAADQAREAATRRDELTRRLNALRREREQAQRLGQEASDTLAQLVREAGVDSADELADVERRVEEVRRLDERIEEVESVLYAEGSLEELERLAEGRDVDQVRARRGHLDERLEELAEAIRDLDQDIGSKRRGLGDLERGRDAYEAAVDLEGQLATVRRLAERWAKLRLAERILSREIDAYREKNQGPIVDRGSEIFPRLTLGEYHRLRIDFDAGDQPLLRCIGVDGAEVGVEALSDGARDQLFLALRLATLERYASHAELMPFVVDDVLIHFDDDRARAALEVLEGFADTGQVIMFTHHARHLELAREASTRLHVHELTGGHRRSRARAAARPG